MAGSVFAKMNFVDAPAGVSRVARIYEADGTSHHPLRAHEVEVADARLLERAPALDREGFALIEHTTRLRDFRDDDELTRVYLPEMKALVAEMTGAHKVHMIPGVGKRVTDERARKESKVRVLEGAQFVHLDYSAQSVPDFLARAIGDDPIDLKRYSRIETYNLWRALSPPPQDMPLALCDARTGSLEDLVTANAEFGDNLNKFEISLVRHTPRQRWCYFPNMTPNELLMFKVWTLKPAQERCVFHGAFTDPSCPKDAVPRISIEARAFVLYE